MTTEAQAGKQPTPALLFDTINAYQRTQAIKTGIELDVFTIIAEGKTTAKAIAMRVGHLNAAYVFSAIISSSSAFLPNRMAHMASLLIRPLSLISARRLTWAR